MKTKYWIILFIILFAVCVCLSLWFFRTGDSCTYAEIRSEGKLIQTIDLRFDQSFTVESTRGTNTITVSDGKIAVTDASCPDHWCMKRGALNCGSDIICLPNQLVIHFVDTESLDATAG